MSEKINISMFGQVWYRKIMIFSCALLVLLIFLGWITLRFIKNDEGICIAENRVLNDEERRKRFIENLVRLKINNSNIHNNLLGARGLRTGIIHNSPVFDFHQLATNYVSNERSFEDNFSIEVVAPGKIKFDLNNYLKEPFSLVSYAVSPQGSATFIETENIKSIKALESSKNKYVPSLYERFQGFGNYYFHITYTIFDSDCCSEQGRGESHEDYIKRKYKAYFNFLNAMETGFVPHTATASASNCGKILIKDSDYGFGLKSIKWIRL